MTDRIDLDAISVQDTARRDQWGRYLVVPPKGGKPIPYTRVTTVAKSLDDGGGLAPWKATMTAAGLIMRRGLRAQWEALLAEGDPWYGSAEGKARAKQLVEDCAAVGGANDRKEVGSALHTITALVDLGRTPKHLTVETERDVDAYVTGLREHNISIVPGAIELAIVLDTYEVAGTFDRLAVVPGFEHPLIADLKTGASLEYSWQSIAVQLAAYSRGEAIYRQGSAKDGSQDVREPMPTVNQDYGLVMWLHDGTLDLYLVDLHMGWDAFHLSMQARGWRKAQPQRALTDATPLPPDPDRVGAQLEASVAVTKARRRRTRSTAVQQAPKGYGGSVDTADPTLPGWPFGGECAMSEENSEQRLDALNEYAHANFREWLQHRIDVIGQHVGAREALINCWPSDFPTLRGSDTHTPDQLAVIERLLDDIERAHSVSFPVARPGSESEQAVDRVVTLFPGTRVIK